jgi:signal transduction histidine kinase
MIPLRVQIAIIVLASVAMLALAGVLVRDVISRTETRLVDETNEQVLTAARELQDQYEERAALAADDPLDALPPQAQDVSLRGLAATVLRSYRGVEGGFRLSGSVVGFTSARPLSTDEAALLNASSPTGGARADWGVDIAVAAAVPLSSTNGVAWAMKRLTGIGDPGVERRRWLLAGLLLSALLGLGAVVSVWYSLRSGVSTMKTGLQQMESDFSYRMPAVAGDFGQIADAANQMATRRTALETELRRQDRLAALGRTVAGVAHEIRNPLNSMKLTLELLSRRLKKGEAQPEQVQGALEQIDRLDQIVGRLLAFGRPALNHRHRQDLRPIMEQAAAMVHEPARRKQVDIQLSVPPDAPVEADVDGPQIQQVLINLLLNAIDASPAGQAVTLSAEANGSGYAVSVADRGSGIPDEGRSHIFDVYYTTKPDGVGLGLSVSREIVANHGGRLEFDSKPGDTVFRFVLPAERSAS